MPCIENDCFSRDSLGSHFTDLKVIAGGAHGCVFSAVDKTSTDTHNVALKRLSLKSRSHCRVALREIRIARRLDHDNVVKVHKITDRDGKDVSSLNLHDRDHLESLYIVQELMDTDLHNVLEKSGKLSEDICKIFLYQILCGLKYIHSSNVIHRDIKPGNLLVNVDDLTLKIGDFGLARICDPRYDHFGHLTELITTRYYRAPEVILDPGMYTPAVDMWSAGCVFAEMLTGDVLFCGDNDMQQADTILSAFGLEATGKLSEMSGGFPFEKFSGTSQLAVDLLEKLLCLNPEKRLTASEALQHPFFGELRDPSDEPVCQKPFYIEHEIDDLPLGTLKRRIISTCRQFLNKSRLVEHDDVVFSDFDQVFVRDEPGNQMDIEAAGSVCCSTSRDNACSESLTDTSDSSLLVPSILSASSENNNCPSLSNVMNYDLMDEPYRDPGCVQSKDSYQLDMEVNDVCCEQKHCTSSYLKVSPLMDFRPVCHVKGHKISEPYEDMNSIEIKTQQKDDLNQCRTFCGRNAVNSSQITVFEKAREFDRLDSAGNDMYSLNRKLVHQLGNNICTFRMSDLVTDKHLNFDALGLGRLEPLRFWI